MYVCTAIMLVEAAMVILKDQSTEAHKIKGIVTPATLGQAYVDRLRNAGVQLQVDMVDR